MTLTQISSWTTPRATALRDVVRTLGVATFNPSVRRIGDAMVMAARAADSATSPATSRVVVLDARSGHMRDDDVLDLAALGASHGIRRVADPKLFTYRGGVWATFNTGYDARGNEVYVVPLFPESGPPIRMEIAGRQTIEKNWAFFEGDRGELWAIYGLEPLTVLSFGTIDAETGEARGEVLVRVPNPSGAGLTIGTQPAMLDGAMVLIAHERVGISKFRGYLGRPVRISNAGGSWSADIGSHRLIHDLATLLGSWPRRNAHLWFATYFSGLDIAEGQVLLSYGVNDARAGVVEFDAGRLWA